MQRALGEKRAKLPHDIDKHVGAQIRKKRIALGISQETLGKEIGVSFQQVQKYERGTNRVSASRLWQIAKALDVPVERLFPS